MTIAKQIDSQAAAVGYDLSTTSANAALRADGYVLEASALIDMARDGIIAPNFISQMQFHLAKDAGAQALLGAALTAEIMHIPAGGAPVALDLAGWAYTPQPLVPIIGTVETGMHNTLLADFSI